MLITETDSVMRALADAATRWPEAGGNHNKLLLLLVAEGHRAVLDELGEAAEQRRELVARTAGVLTGVYARNYLAELRDDWPQ